MSAFELGVHSNGKETAKSKRREHGIARREKRLKQCAQMKNDNRLYVRRSIKELKKFPLQDLFPAVVRESDFDCTSSMDIDQ